MKSLKFGLWIFIIFLFRSVLLRFIRIGGIAPELLYVFTLCIAMNEKKPQYYIIAGVLCGLIADVTSGMGYGFYLISYTASSLLLIVLGDFIYKDKAFMIVPVTLIFSFLQNTAFFFVNNKVLGELVYGDVVFSIILPIAIYNTVIALIFNTLIKRTLYRKRKNTF